MQEQNIKHGIVWLNGEYTDFATGTVSLEDRGFVFGDGVYEVIRAYEGKPLAMAEHLTRLEQSAAGIELELSLTTEQIAAIASDLLQRSGIGQAEIYIQVTRGAARRNHLFPDQAEPTVLIGVRPTRAVPTDAWEKGVAVITLPDERWARCNLKTICLLPNVLAKEKAHRAGVFEAVLIRDGLVMEGTASNLFLWRDGDLLTPVSDNRILPGITRMLTIKLARERGYNVIERDIKPEEIFAAQEVFLTSTTIELMPVVRLDDRVVGTGRPGDIRADLHAAFRALTE